LFVFCVFFVFFTFGLVNKDLKGVSIINAQEEQQVNEGKTLSSLSLLKEQGTIVIRPASSSSSPVTLKATYPSSVNLSSQQKGLKCERGGSIEVSFVTVSENSQSQSNPITPQQAIVKLTNKATGHEADFVTKANRATGKHDITINPSTFGEAFKYQSGQYSIDIVVADVSIKNPTIWRIVDTIEVVSTSAPTKKKLPLYYEPLLHESDISIGQLPEIHHVFRVPDKRPPEIVSYAFALGSLGLLATLPIILILSGANVKGLTINPLPYLYLGTVGLIFSLYGFYWYTLNMFQLLGYLSPLLLLLLIIDRMGGLSILDISVKGEESENQGHSKTE